MLWPDVKKMTARCLRLRARDLGEQVTGSRRRASGAGDRLLVAPIDRAICVTAVLAANCKRVAVASTIVDAARSSDLATQEMLANL